MFIYPQTSNAKLFEDDEQLYGKARYQLVEGNTYVYEFSDPNLQFKKEDEIISFHQIEILTGTKEPSRQVYLWGSCL